MHLAASPLSLINGVSGLSELEVVCSHCPAGARGHVLNQKDGNKQHLEHCTKQHKLFLPP